MFDICCLGLLVVDITATPVDKLPNVGGVELLDGIQQGLGGCAANTGIAMAKIGYNIAVIGKVGNDSFGKYTLDVLAENNINIKGVAQCMDVPTSSAIVLLNSEAERSFLHVQGANGTINVDDIDFSIIQNSKILHIAGANLMPRLDGEPTGKILKRAQQAGVYTSMDTAYDAFDRWMENIGPCLEHLDLFVPSYDEARMLSGKTDVAEMADFFLSHGVKLCVIKTGKDGCYIKNNSGSELSVPTFDDIKVADTTGAGDAFVAGFLTGILQEWTLESCGRFANAVGSMCVSQMGTSEGIRSLNDTLSFLRERNIEIKI